MIPINWPIYFLYEVFGIKITRLNRQISDTHHRQKYEGTFHRIFDTSDNTSGNEIIKSPDRESLSGLFD